MKETTSCSCRITSISSERGPSPVSMFDYFVILCVINCVCLLVHCMLMYVYAYVSLLLAYVAYIREFTNGGLAKGGLAIMIQ